MQAPQTSQRGKPVWEATRSVMFIFGSAIIGMIATRNSLYPYIDKVWGVSHDFWGALWNTIYEFFGRSDFCVHMFGTFMAGVLSFCVFNAVFLLCDATGHPSWLLKYKVQEEKNTPVDRERLWKCIKVCVFNLSVISPIFTLVVYPVAAYLGALHKGDLPTFERVLVEFVVFAVFEEIFFYYSHRLLHMPYFYSKYHKMHHEWTAPIGVTSIYCGSLEMVASNLLPITVGPLIMQSHLLTMWLWFSLVVFSTTIAHGGYHVPFLFSPEAHDFHHKVFNCWYGTLGILDKLHKTDRPFTDSINETRHFISFSLTPVKDIYPDPPKSAREPASSASASY